MIRTDCLNILDGIKVSKSKALALRLLATLSNYGYELNQCCRKLMIENYTCILLLKAIYSKLLFLTHLYANRLKIRSEELNLKQNKGRHDLQ